MIGGGGGGGGAGRLVAAASGHVLAGLGVRAEAVVLLRFGLLRFRFSAIAFAAAAAGAAAAAIGERTRMATLQRIGIIIFVLVELFYYFI